MQKYIFVTGSAGFIGFHLSKLLLDEGYYVIGIDSITDYYDVELKLSRLRILKKYKDFAEVKLDITNFNSLEKIFKQYRPEFIVHLAAQAGVRYSIENPRSYLNSNIIGTFNILEMIKKYDVSHTLIASTSSVYGSNTEMPFEEIQKTETQMSFYAATKKSCEIMSHSYSHIHNLPITNLMKRDFTYVTDLVKAISLLISCIPKKGIKKIESDSLSPIAPWRVVNIGNSNTQNLSDFISEIENNLNCKANKNFMPMQQGDVKETYADCKLLYELTGFKPNTSIKEGIKEFCDWYSSYYLIK